MAYTVKYTASWFLLGCSVLVLASSVAHADVRSTPKQVLSAVALGAANKQAGTCSSNIVADGSFESSINSTPWTGFSLLNGNPICDPSCGGGSPKDAFNGFGYVYFANDPSLQESAYVEQQIILPQVDFAYVRFYVKGSAAGAPLTFTLSVDGDPLLSITGEFTAAYTEFIPLAYDLSPYLDGKAHTLRFEIDMDPGAFTQVALDDVCVEAVEFGEGENPACIEICSQNGTDSDNDGVPDNCEVCRGSNPIAADSDGDGMDDRFEQERGLNPLNPADAQLDPDGDGLSNFGEFAQDSDPFDRDDPNTVRFVSPNGVNTPAGGSSNAPWRTLLYAINQIPATADRRGTVTLLPGVYTENVVLKSHVGLRASSPLAAAIVGSIEGAEASSLDDLRLVPASSSNYMLEIVNLGMEIRGCAFDGTPVGGGVGVYTEGDESARTQFSGCTFNGLDIGIDIYGSLPGVRTSRITEWFQVGLWVHPLDDDDRKNGGIGDLTSAEVGFNQFFEGFDGPAVRYEREITLVCEQNYWGTVDPDVVPTVIDGNADFIPFLASSAILPASVFCTVINAADQSRVTDARVFLDPSSVNAVTVNTNGVYNFGAVNDGRYTVRAESDLLGEATATIDVGSGEIGAVVLVLGEGDTPPPPGCGCNNAKTSAPGAADLVVAASALLSMVLAARAFRPIA